ncbi:MAG TPA: thrombospondin type 3 repeat-containing protein [bacterium]|nr:thrombospondin type 3 repeat-containing protein [bacterium]
MKKTLSIVTFLVLAACAFISKPAHAAWGDIYCDIFNGSTSALEKAIELYNADDETDRACTAAVRFFAPGKIDIPNGLTITQAPPSGHTYGLAIRKCVATGSTPEAGCPQMSNTNVVLDASGYAPNGGLCPIKVYQGAKMDFINFKLIVKDPTHAICTGGGQPVPIEDTENPYAWIHNVTICASNDPNCTPQVPETDCDDGADNDGDGKTDCEDTDCNTNPSLCPDTEENCNNGIDDDGDGKTDCEDTDCADDTAHCSGTEDCDDNVDNDGDGKKDCEDTDCATNPACTDPDDSDGDGTTNADDLCDKDSTGNTCDSTNLEACFSDQTDNVCAGAGVGSGVSCSEVDDMDNDGRGNRCDEDIDGDGLKNGSDPDPYDPDADNDGVCDGPTVVTGVCTTPNDPCPLLNGVVKNSLGQCAAEPVNPSETDADGDGLTATLEESIGTDPNVADTDGDGANDGVDCFPLDNTKNLCGGATTVIDPDFDDDGICNGAESATDPVTNNPCTPNPQGQGDNCPATPNADQKDDNHNGVGDACEISSSVDGDGDLLPDDLEENVFHTDPTKSDTDGDGLSDSDEVSGPTYQNGEGPLNPDVDADGICDGPATVSDDAGEICNAGPGGTGDNCPIVKNEDQADSDGNGRGDACDGDMDGDGAKDDADNCPFIANTDQLDSNEDGVGDVCDPNMATIANNGGCGCRMDGGSGSAKDALPFAALMLPLALLRLARRRTNEE